MAKTVCEEKNNQLCDYLQKIDGTTIAYVYG